MSERHFGLNGLADQRYYHFIAMRTDSEASLSTHWRKFADTQRAPKPVEFSSAVCEVQHRKLRSRTSYARGAVAQLLSEKGDGLPPFFYDVFLARLIAKGESYILFGFPFAGLALELSGGIAARESASGRGEFQGALVPRLLTTLEKSNPRRFDELTTRVVGVQFKVEDDKSLSAVRLGGDDPLGAGIYREYIKERIDRGEVLPDTCVLACEREWASTLDRPGETQSFRSRIHVDAYGNFKFYAQVGLANLRLLPYAIGQLKLWGALRPVAGNPLRRLGREDLD